MIPVNERRVHQAQRLARETKALLEDDIERGRDYPNRQAIKSLAGAVLELSQALLDLQEANQGDRRGGP